MFFKYVFIQDLRPMALILTFVEQVYERNSEECDRHYAICCKYARYSRLIIKFMVIVYPALTILFASAVLADSWRGGVLKPLFCLYLPSIDGDADFMVDAPTMVCNVVIVITGLLVVCPYDAMIQMAFCHMPMLATIFANEINRFQSDLRRRTLERSVIKSRLLKIIQMQEDYKA